MKKKLMKMVSVMIAVSMVVSAFGMNAEAAGKKVKLNKKTVKIAVGDSVKLKVKNKAKKAKVKWKSKNKKVATVSKKGKVVGRKVGSAKIVCTVKNSNKKVKLTCKVKVLKINNNSQNSVGNETPKDENDAKPSAQIEQKPTAKPTEKTTEKPAEQPTGQPTSAADTNTSDSSDIAPHSDNENNTENAAIFTGSASVNIGMTVNELEQTMGNAAFTLPAEYNDCSWYIYNADYEKFAMVLVKNDKVAGVYADGKAFSYNNINSNTTANTLANEGFATNSYKETYYKTEGNLSVNAYVDALGDETIEGILVMEKMSSTIKTGTATTFEKISFELTNSFRVKNGLPVLTWNDSVANVARAHSNDMSANNYFDHTSPSGDGPADRLLNAGLRYSAYAENIAMGYENGIEVTYGWINSSGHRSNMLFETVTNLGVGVEAGCTYYTQLFYKSL